MFISCTKYALFFLLIIGDVLADNAQPSNGYTQLNCPIALHHTRPHDKKITYTHIPFKEGTSLNWSGYVAVNNINNPSHNTVEAVAGSWVVPALSSEPNTTYSSIWIGIDGYSSATVEQIGTEHDWVNGQQVNTAWFEMYPNSSYEIVGFPVNVGDSISACVVYAGSDVFVLSIFNNTKKVFAIIPTAYTTSASAQRSSAEWVVEAPYENGVLPLSKFGVVNFSSCLATINNVIGSISNPSWANTSLTMVTSTNAVKSLPSALANNGTSFSVTWQHE
jgi:peptidase A4-like protein